MIIEMILGISSRGFLGYGAV